MAKRWEFVPTQTSRGSDSDAAARRFVRGTAMRAFRQRQRLERARQLVHRDNQLADSQKCEKIARRTCSRVDCEPVDLDLPDNSVKKLHPSAEIPSKSTCALQNASLFLASYEGGGWNHRSEPFTVRSSSHDVENLELSKFNEFEAGFIAIHPSYIPLFKHFVSVVAPSLHPLSNNSIRNPIITIWAQAALTEPAMLEATLFHAGAHIDQLHKKPWSKQTLFHRGQAIRLVNKMLKNPEQSISDTNIATVSMLAGTGNLTADQNETNMHMEALKRLVHRRGGLNCLGMDGVLEIYISTLDCMFASLSMSTPYFEQTKNLAVVTAASGTPLLSILNADFLSWAEFDNKTRSFFGEISRAFTTLEEFSNTAKATKAGSIAFNKTRSAIEHKLLSTHYLPAEYADGELQRDIFDSARIAALICVNYTFRDLSPTLPFSKTNKKNLMEAIMRIEASSNQNPSQWSMEVLLWTYFIGGIVSIERSWFGERISNMMSHLGFDNWEPVAACLRAFVWSKKLEDRNCINLWTEVQHVSRTKLGQFPYRFFEVTNEGAVVRKR